ncbi:MAG: hypothetical protein HOV80_31400 [Polyangiaceae bacterium]|nr:hypothetical protein [Polyangiaceae bacterium]
MSFLKLSFVFALLFAGACSLEGLSDGTGGGTSSSTTQTSASTAATSSSSTGGAGGEASVFTWVTSFGNDLVQGTRPYGSDAGSGSTLRMSDAGPDGDVWIAAATKGAIDPDGVGGSDALGNPLSTNLFLAHVGADGTLLGFFAFEGNFLDIDDTLQIGGVVRLPGDAIAILGTLKGGNIDFGAAGTVEQTSATDDAFVVRIDANGVATHARELGGANSQLLRAGALQGQKLLVTGRFKRILDVRGPDGASDAPCAYNQPMEDYERTLVASFDADNLSCTRLATFAATTASAVQQAHALAVDATGIYIAGTFTRELIAPPLPAMPKSAGEDGYIDAIEPSLQTPEARWTARLTSNRATANDGVRALALWGGSLWVGGFQERGTNAVMSQEPALGVVDMSVPTCTLALAEGRDGVVGRLDPSTGECEGAIVLGAAQEDEVRGMAALADGIVATGFTTGGIPALDGSAGGGSRDGFFARFEGAGVVVAGGRTLGGVSWDYLDAARPVDGALVLGGSYDASFDVLKGHADFFVGKMTIP